MSLFAFLLFSPLGDSQLDEIFSEKVSLFFCFAQGFVKLLHIFWLLIWWKAGFFKKSSLFSAQSDNFFCHFSKKANSETFSPRCGTNGEIAVSKEMMLHTKNKANELFMHGQQGNPILQITYHSMARTTFNKVEEKSWHIWSQHSILVHYPTYSTNDKYPFSEFKT